MINLKQAAQLLGKSRQWVWVLVRLGKLPATKIGRVYILNRIEVLEFKENQLTGSVKQSNGGN